MMRAAAGFGSLVVASGTIYFSETFGKGWEDRWVVSERRAAQGEQGRWTASAGKWFRDEEDDTGLQTAEDSRYFSISATFDPFSNADKDLILQYQAKYEKDVECGGGYLKIGPPISISDQKVFGDITPFSIMFGPDQCGFMKRTDLRFFYQRKIVRKKVDMAYKQEGEGITHLYRLLLKPDNTVRVEVDGEKLYEGSLKDDWELLQPKEIHDPDEKKPSDWVDTSTIDDPEDTKPKDWVEDKRVVDLEASPPDDWTEEEDGEWEAPMKDNPEYKGEWVAKRISNPEYKGVWKAKMIANPKYVDDDATYKYEDLGFVGFDLWQVKGGTIFDNVIVTDDVAEADAFAKKWKDLSEVEKAKKAEEDEAEKAQGEEL